MHVAWYILYAVCVIATLAIPFFVEAPGGIISSASLVIGIISLGVTHATILTAQSIKGLKSTQSLVEQLKELATSEPAMEQLAGSFQELKTVCKELQNSNEIETEESK